MELTVSEKANLATSIVATLGGVGFVLSCIASTDTFQKCHIKYRLMNSKFPRPHHMDKVYKIDFIYFISKPYS